MKEIHVNEVISAVERLCIEANCILNQDVIDALNKALGTEESPQGREVLQQLLENAEIAGKENIPICQDTGMAVLFVEVGQDLHIIGGDLTGALNEGVRRGYEKGFLRKSIVKDPFNRINTGDNTPAVIHYEIVSGDKIGITIAPKGFGSENMGALKMFKPSDGLPAVKNFVVETVDKAGPNPCPPIVVGVGLGGTMEKAAYLAKKALLRPIGESNPVEEYARLEQELLTQINHLGIGPQGFGGRTTALAVNIEVFPTHIAGLPAAVNINCHVTRHCQVILEGRVPSCE
ncbi:fumarate hydratase [Dehalobacter sp. 12DCB1]|uniref:fumarate hydratase n=1 Tax=Dehalobacter sp. 12DCB1 TaxID=2070364 RepID=UPI001045D158|nr:fumarate hydratase [Dehalobacter sp. 12DCB1]TCX51086.1 fumarate hydratase [Dehalobacter sp. 12DCB1]